MAKKSLAEKVFYKIWDIKHKEYVKVSHEKATWMTLNGVQDKVRDMCKRDRYSYHGPQRNPEDFEIQMFHMVQFDRMNGREAYEAKEKKANEEKLRYQQIEAVKQGIKNVLPGMDFYRIRECISNKYFSDEIANFLKGEFAKITELEKRK